MALGNSITAGKDTYPSYRYALYERLTKGYIDFAYVGSLTSTQAPATPLGTCPDEPLDIPPLAHEGHWGWRADEIINGKSGAASEGKLADWLQGYTPDVVLLHIGSNDMFQSQSVSSTVGDIREVVRILRQDNPEVTILLAKLFPAQESKVGTTVVNNLNLLNEEIPGLVQELNSTSSPVLLVDQNTGFDPTPGADTYDGIHPNERGARAMAENWYNVLKTVLNSYTTPPVVEIKSPQDNTEHQAGQKITIAADAWDREEKVERVEFYVDCQKIGEDYSSPFEISWAPLEKKSYSLLAVATDAAGAQGKSYEPVYITVVDGVSGGVTREYWSNVDGNTVSSIPVSSTPTSVTQLSSFEAPSNVGGNYGQRVRGYIKAPVTGEYTFWIASDDHSELWLSTSESPADKVKLAYISGYTNQKEWGKYTSQQSVKVRLEAGKRYYIEALHKEGWGNDNLAVGWQLPDGTMERPVPGHRLSPYEPSSGNQPPTAYAGADKSITLPANSVSLTGSGSDSDGSISSYSWSKVSGPSATLSGASTANLSVSGMEEGTYVFRLTVTDNGGEHASDEATVTVHPEPSTGTGIVREFWANVSGTSVSDIPVNTPPTSTSTLSLFEAPMYTGDNYGVRVRAYVHAPATGSYTFWIASDDHSELWLSTDENPANKVRIAYVNGSTGSRQWTKFPSQQSSAITLQGGRKYYIEALHKEGTGVDHLAVGWQLPDGILERPIPANRLTPYEGGSSSNQPPVAYAGSDMSITLPANTITLSGTGTDADGTISGYEWSKVSGPGSVVFSNKTEARPTVTGLVEGTYTFRLTVTDNDGASASDEMKVTVHPEPSSDAPVVREVWENISGSTVAAIPVNTAPTSTSQLTLFEAPSNVGGNYGARVRAYVHAPSSGHYTFWIASDDDSELWLSTDENPANKRKIASVSGWTTPRQWDKYASQTSAAVWLQAGKKYYIEALHKEGWGNDNLAVGWQLPDGTMERPVPGHRLSPFVPTQTATAQVRTGSALDAADALLTYHPNPFSSQVTLQLHGIKGEKYSMKLYDISGREVWHLENVQAEQKLSIGKNLSAGVYILVVDTGKEAKQYKLVKAQ
ncbi:hypothetical protein GCM10027443_00820 [Pontibacter brevis]